MFIATYWWVWMICAAVTTGYFLFRLDRKLELVARDYRDFVENTNWKEVYGYVRQSKELLLMGLLALVSSLLFVITATINSIH